MKSLLLTLCLLLGSISAFAHGDHTPPRVAACITADCTKEQIEKGIPLAVDSLISLNLINKNWKDAKVESVELKKFDKSSEWTVKLFDAKEKDTTKKNLFIFITKKGFLNGANYTGE